MILSGPNADRRAYVLHIDAAREQRLAEGLEDRRPALFVFDGEDQGKRDAFGREGRFRPDHAFNFKPPFRRFADAAAEIRRVALGGATISGRDR